MQHSIAAKYAARPAAHFVRPSDTAREPRLGLRPAGTYRPAVRRPAFAQQAKASPLARLRAASRRITAARPARSSIGQLRPAIVMHWAGSRAGRVARRTGAAPAPWRA